MPRGHGERARASRDGPGAAGDDRFVQRQHEVEFFWPFRGAYWIIELDPDYHYAVVGHPARAYLWILARRPEMRETVYHKLLRRIAAHGYDPARVERTPQPAE